MEKKSFVKEYLEPIVIAILIALFIRAFVVQAFKIPSGSMEETLLVGDHILVNKFIYGTRIPFTDIKLFRLKSPKRGDVIVFIYPKDTSKDFIKRVIGTEGEKVEIIGKKIYINDKAIDDPWGNFKNEGELAKFFQTGERFGPYYVPKDSLFVMGDNRNNSQDSRYWGYVNLNAVKGKAFIIYFSLKWEAEKLWEKVRWNRFGKLIH
jgi:signal peptidase I